MQSSTILFKDGTNSTHIFDCAKSPLRAARTQVLFRLLSFAVLAKLRPFLDLASQLRPPQPCFPARGVRRRLRSRKRIGFPKAFGPKALGIHFASLAKIRRREQDEIRNRYGTDRSYWQAGLPTRRNPKRKKKRKSLRNKKNTRNRNPKSARRNSKRPAPRQNHEQEKQQQDTAKHERDAQKQQAVHQQDQQRDQQKQNDKAQAEHARDNNRDAEKQREQTTRQQQQLDKDRAQQNHVRPGTRPAGAADNNVREPNATAPLAMHAASARKTSTPTSVARTFSTSSAATTVASTTAATGSNTTKRGHPIGAMTTTSTWTRSMMSTT